MVSRFLREPLWCGILLNFLLRLLLRLIERHQLVGDFVAMRIAPRLPLEFAFVNRSTTVRELIERAGSPDRDLQLPASPDEVNQYPLIQTPDGRSALRVLRYKLPYFARVSVLPEHPFTEDSRIRSVTLFPSRRSDDEDEEESDE